MASRSAFSRPTLVAVASAAAALALCGGTTVVAAASDPGNTSTDTDGFHLTSTQISASSRASSPKAVSSGFAKTPSGLRHLTSAKPIPVMIKYDYDALASYAGTVRGYPATSPSETGAPMSTTSPESTRYLALVEKTENAISAEIGSVVPTARITRSFHVVYGGVAAVLPGNEITKVLGVPGVVAVQRDGLAQPQDDASSDFINSGQAYTQQGGRAGAGKGVLLGNIDTGVWPEHPAFAARPDLPAYSGPAIPCEFGDNPLTAPADPFVCNNKLVGGQWFMDTYEQVNGPDSYTYPGTARDAEGHGSHTASTSAGSTVKNVQTVGPTVARVAGIAPGAQISEYRVCGPAGCYSSDSASAVEQAITDGVDVINYSISGGSNPATDPVELAFLDAYNAGVFVAASAGNSGPGAGTAEHASPWVTTVGASTQKREFTSTLTLDAANGDTYQVDGASLTHGAGPLPIVRASSAPYSDALCTTPAPAGSFSGKIVLCERGGNGRVEKGFNVKQGGAAGMVLYNPTLADVETDNHWLPTVHIADGTAMLAFIAAHDDITATFTSGAKSIGQGDVMAAFSSRGPLGNFVKPDITAPGVQILAAMTPTPDAVVDGPPGQYWQAIAGTSMSSPHVAGAAILVKAVHPDWTPGQIKSALMTQSRTGVVKEDLVTPADPFDRGAGRVDVGRAIHAPLTIAASASDMGALFDDPLHALDLNIPSIDAPVMPGRVTTTRQVTNVTSEPLTVHANARFKPGTRITLSPRSTTIPAGGVATFTVTLESKAPVGEQQFAQIDFDTPKGSAHLPVAFVRKQGSVSLDQSCDDGSLAVGETTTCTVSATNNSFDEQDVVLNSKGSANLRVVGGKVTKSATLAGAELGVPSMGPGTTPGGGFLDLADYGVDAEAIGDEEIANFDVPTFTYNGQPFTRVGVDSNGYVVVGGGTSSDNECCNLPSGPSSAAPNNILAPFWTDLDGTDARGISIGVLGDGTNKWLVVQWDVNIYGTDDLRSFETWIGLGDTQDISYAYSEAQTDPGQPYLVGAENAAGEGDVQALLPADDIVITSTDPVPGDVLSYDVTMRAVQSGVGVLHSELDAGGVAGTTVVETPVEITDP